MVPQRRQLQASAWILTLLPLGLAVFMAVITPGYFMPMLKTPLGMMMIGAVIVLLLLATAAFRTIARWAQSESSSRARWASLLMMLPMIFLIFPALWIILLGPSLLLILTARP